MRSRESRKKSIKDKIIPIFWIVFFSVFFIWSPRSAAAPANGEALPGLDKLCLKAKKVKTILDLAVTLQ